VLSLPDYPGRVYTLDYSPDGRFIATGHTDHNVRLWELEPTEEGALELTNVVTLSGHTEALFRVAFSPDGRYLASASWDNTARLWDTETLTTVHTLEHGSFVYSVAFDPTGRYLATGARDAMVRLWDLSNLSRGARPAPELIGLYPGHSDLVWDVAFSPDGTYLASSSWDQTIRRYLVNFEDVWALSDVYLEGEASAPPE
jgi:WD40 repeat protein